MKRAIPASTEETIAGERAIDAMVQAGAEKISGVEKLPNR
jgi:hypothetical protein